MRILVVAQVFWPENFRINDLVAELVQRGHEVTVLTGIPNYPEGVVFPSYAKDPDSFGEHAGASIVRIPIITRGHSRWRLVLNYLSFAVSGALLGALKLRRRRFDVIFVYEPSPITVGIPAVVLRSLKNAPIVFWVLDLWPETLEAIGVLKSQRALRAVGRLVSFIYNRCDLILGQSHSFLPQIRKYAPDDTPVRYFPSWAEAIFQNANDEPVPEIPVKYGSFDVLFAGNIGEAQDFPSIVEAADLLRGHTQIRWIIVGDGRMAEWLRAEVERRDLGQTVLLLGRHPVERMPSFYKRANALLVTLKDEPIFAMTIPGKLQSYLAAGIPIVAMLNGEGADVVKRAACGVACPAGNPKGLADAVLELFNASPESLAEMGRKAVATSRREFDRKMLLDQLESWLREVAQSPGPSLKRNAS